MRTSNAGKVEIIGHEGIGLTKYKDSEGVWTIGCGLTSTEIPDIASWPMSRSITIQQCFDLFEKGLVPYEDELNKNLTKPILQTQFDALISWSYNVGWGWDKKATVVAEINKGDSPQQLYDALMMFTKQKEVTGRRTMEAKLLRDGVYSEGGRATLFPVSPSGVPLYSKGKVINVWQYINVSDVLIPPSTSPSVVASVLNWFTGQK